MARTDFDKGEPRGRPLINPWLPLLAGLAATLIAALLPKWSGTAGVLMRVVPVVAGLIAAGAAVSLRLRHAGPGVEERARSAILLGVAALVPLLAYASLNDVDAATNQLKWDSVCLVLGVMTGVGVVGAVLILLPTVARRVVISLLLLVHFGGILTAITSVSPPGADPPWLTTTVWTRFYRPYLQFMYLNNAYHFYSPEPGPPTLLWFHIDYDDGSERWVRLPEREQFLTRQEYQRRLALTESTNMLVPPLPAFPREAEDKRLMAGTMHNPPIPVHPQVPSNVQCRLPTAYSGLMVAAYARHAAHNYPSEKNPSAKVTRVIEYRVVHSMLSPEQMKEGMRPTDPSTYLPYYQGTFDADGNLMNLPDPFLYWLIPIMWTPEKMLPPGFPEEYVSDRRDVPGQGPMVLVDYTRVQTHSKPAPHGQ
jgi:hypothetical protein